MHLIPSGLLHSSKTHFGPDPAEKALSAYNNNNAYHEECILKTLLKQNKHVR